MMSPASREERGHHRRASAVSEFGGIFVPNNIISETLFTHSFANRSIYHKYIILFVTMNSTAIQLNNAAVDAIHTGNLAKGFNILLRACADQNRISKNDHTDSRGARLTHMHHSSYHSSGNKANDQSIEYYFEDCSNLLLLPMAQNNRSSAAPVAVTTVSRQEKLRLLNLKFLKINPLLPSKKIDDMCRCGISWVLGYNLSILCAFVGLRIPDSRSYYLRKSLALLGPIHRTILKRRSASPFWSTLKLSVLNNYALVLNECSMDTQRVILAMELLLEKTIMAQRVDPSDADKFQRNLQCLQGSQGFDRFGVAVAAAA